MSGEGYSWGRIEVSSLNFFQLQVRQNLSEHNVEYLDTLRILRRKLSGSFDCNPDLLSVMFSGRKHLSDLNEKNNRIIIILLSELTWYIIQSTVWEVQHNGQPFVQYILNYSFVCNMLLNLITMHCLSWWWKRWPQYPHNWPGWELTRLNLDWQYNSDIRTVIRSPLKMWIYLAYSRIGASLVSKDPSNQQCYQWASQLNINQVVPSTE